MNKGYWLLALLLITACNEKTKEPTAQEIVDRSILVSGGENYRASDISFRFRDMVYTASGFGNNRVLTRSFQKDSAHIKDVRTPKDFKRYVNDSLVVLSDSLANVYSNSVNSVHYFAYLPYGLNDAAVNKKYLGKVRLNEKEYYKVEITFDQEGGGDDFDDVYVYWFNSKTFNPDYLAYEFQVDGGGQRFRKAFNERVVGGIRFVDYQNYKNTQLDRSIHDIDELYESNALNLLSEIKLEDISVNPGNYN
ncbi:DUF6503 family protein [Maribacter chungangensis]|jgi:hypothetical protein|uniref:DUF6503 family protein n=1 Tax=Maribacter chungangensis TaxID=1069117 RepID=A0ABW3B3F4_9FLAO